MALSRRILSAVGLCKEFECCHLVIVDGHQLIESGNPENLTHAHSAAAGGGPFWHHGDPAPWQRSRACATPRRTHMSFPTCLKGVASPLEPCDRKLYFDLSHSDSVQPSSNTTNDCSKRRECF